MPRNPLNCSFVFIARKKAQRFRAATATQIRMGVHGVVYMVICFFGRCTLAIIAYCCNEFAPAIRILASIALSECCDGGGGIYDGSDLDTFLHFFRRSVHVSQFIYKTHTSAYTHLTQRRNECRFLCAFFSVRTTNENLCLIFTCMCVRGFWHFKLYFY